MWLSPVPKSELHVFGQAKMNSKGDVAATSGSVLHRLWDSVGDDFERCDIIETDDAIAPAAGANGPSSAEFEMC